MRSLHAALALVLFAAAAQAQILAVSFKDEKIARKYKDHLVVINGESVVVGEGKYAIYVDDKIHWAPTGRNEVWVSDPGDPSFVPYKYKGEDKLPTSPKGVLEIAGADIKGVRELIKEQSLAGLAAEYRERMAKIQEISSERDGAPKASRAWFMAHQRLISNYERLQNWLAGTCFPIAAKKIDKEIERQRKNVAADALLERVTAAKASVQMVETPVSLTEAALAATEGKLTFKVQESLHARIVYRTDITDERVHALLEFAEEAIDGFRGDCVDPYVGDDFEDKIPDRKFAEWCFAPTDFETSERFLKEFYRKEVTDHREERSKIMGMTFTRRDLPESIHYWRWEEKEDLEGQVAHGLGHDLTALHYNLSLTRGTNQDWMFEGVGFYVSLEFLGRNSVTCHEFKESTYVHEKRKPGERNDQMGQRDVYNALALDAGPTIDKLAVKELFSLDDPDVAKAWSFYDFLVKKEGKKGQLFLRAACKLANDKPTFIQKWRELSNEIFENKEGDVFKTIDTRWREYAETGQQTGDVSRRK